MILYSVMNLKKPGTYAGNDAIVAFARLHGLNVVIHQMNSPLWQVCHMCVHVYNTIIHIVFFSFLIAVKLNN